MIENQRRLGYHLVAYLDVLGQRIRFKDWRLPRSQQEQTHMADVLRQTAGFVVGLRKEFAKQYTEFEAGLHNLRKQTSARVRPRFVGISDSFITSVPLNNPDGDLIAAITVYSAISAAAVVMLVSLASNHALRGGIDVGLATDIGDDEIYGPVVASAYKIESEEAEYPRIVVGEGLWRYLDLAYAHFTQQALDSEARSVASVFEAAKGLITVDDFDGKKIVDYLGPTMVTVTRPGDDCRQHMIGPAYEFVLMEQKRFTDAGDQKHVPRYNALRSYMEARLHFWGRS